MTFDYDLFTIGAGSGGVRASRFSASYGAKVGIAEDRFYGGTCVNIGCVPKKLMVYASHFREDFADAAGYGWTVGTQSFDWPTLVANKDKEIARLNGAYERTLRNAGVTIHWGRARIVGPNEVEIAGKDGAKRVRARHILVATGATPTRGSEPGAELALVSDDLFHLKQQPKRLLVVGGGYIAVEFAGIFAGLGSAVTQVYRGPLFLRGFDRDCATFVAAEMRKKHVDLRFATTVERIEKAGAALRVRLSDGSDLAVDAVLHAIGRRPNVGGIGLEAAGVKLDKAGAVIVDEYSQTTAEGIHAIGDVTDRMNLTPVALAEGNALAKTLFKGTPTKPDYLGVPTAVFSQPPMATVGLSEEQARRQYGAVDIYAADFKPMKHTMSGRDERTYMKLVVEPRSDRVLGAHMVGQDAPEIVQGLAIALKAGATKAQFDATIGIHPSAAEEFVTMREKRPEPKVEPQAAE